MKWLANVFKGNFLSNPGDKATLKVTESGRKVGIFEFANGLKMSRTEYPNGTVHETRTFKKK